MKELHFLEIIKEHIGEEFIGDDCAYLKDFGLVITQDNLVEDIHFKREWITPFQLGYKSVAVNISDVLASGAKPEYITVALSLPKTINSDFIEQFYKGAQKALGGIKIVGGDITGSDKIFISITALGSTKGRNISSRCNAKVSDVVITKGEFGASSRGLKELQNGILSSENIKKHLEPSLEIDFSEQIAKNIQTKYAMMDTSDGLADALFRIATASGVKIVVDYSKIPGNNIYTPEEVLFGGEDYKLVAVVAKDELYKISNYTIIGEVLELNDNIFLEVGKNSYSSYDELGVFNHFGE